MEPGNGFKQGRKPPPEVTPVLCATSMEADIRAQNSTMEKPYFCTHAGRSMHLFSRAYDRSCQGFPLPLAAPVSCMGVRVSLTLRNSGRRTAGRLRRD